MSEDRQRLLEHLASHQVEYVVVGGAALETHRPGFVTVDIDVAPAKTQENLERLAAALNSLDARLVIDETGEETVVLPAGYFTARSVRDAPFWNLQTRFGKLDVCFEPAAFPGGYDELRPNAELKVIQGTTIAVPVASLADVERSKRAAARPKDLAYLKQYDEA